jgi:putative ABC transport system ATP-binding protein
MTQPVILSVSGLTKSYCSGGGFLPILKHLDLQVARGETVALLGASGSGKTTLLNLLSGIDQPDAGEVLVDGMNVHHQGEPAQTLFRRRHIGFVFQFFNLIPTLSVGENVALPMELLGEGNGYIQSRVDDLLDRVGLRGMAERYPETLSGGEQQRTAVARALAHHPKLLLADEPTGNLDEETGDRVISLLMEMATDQGTTMLIVTHSTRVSDVADRVFRLRNGKLQGQ